MSDTERSPKEVLDDHLEKAKTGTVEENLARNYDPNLVTLTTEGAYRGYDGARFLAER